MKRVASRWHIEPKSVYSPAEPNASFGITIPIKAMMANTTTNTNIGEGLPPKSREWLLIEGGADPWQLFYVSAAASATKPKAGFGRTILIKPMAANAKNKRKYSGRSLS